MRVPKAIRALVWRSGRRLIEQASARLKLATYVPLYDYREHLDAHTSYVVDERPIRDKRPSTVESGVDLTLTQEGLEDVVAGRSWEGLRVLEVGPKYGIHSTWIDRHLRPAEIVFSDFASDRHLHEQWAGKLQSAHRWLYGDLRHARELLELEQVDLVFFLGVLYHSAFHLPLLGMLNRTTRLGGEMLLETTVDPRPDSAVRLRWQPGTGKAKAIPTIDALRIELAWTGWRDVVRFSDYRPGSSEALFLCRKTDELPEGADVIELVTPHRQEPQPATAAPS